MCEKDSKLVDLKPNFWFEYLLLYEVVEKNEKKSHFKNWLQFEFWSNFFNIIIIVTYDRINWKYNMLILFFQFTSLSFM